MVLARLLSQDKVLVMRVGGGLRGGLEPWRWLPDVTSLSGNRLRAELPVAAAAKAAAAAAAAAAARVAAAARLCLWSQRSLPSAAATAAKAGAPSLQLAGPSSTVPGERKQDQRRLETISLGPLALARLLAGSCSLSLWLESSLPPALESSWGGVGSCPRLGWREPCVQQRKPGGPGPSQPSADECQGAERAEAGPAALSPEPDLCFPQRQWRQQRRSPQLRSRWWHLRHAGGTAALPVFFIHAGADCPGHSHLLSPRAVPLHFPHPQA